MRHAHLEHAGIADDDETGRIREPVIGQNARDLFGADASAIAPGVSAMTGSSLVLVAMIETLSPYFTSWI
ncbi:hypothetical protein ACVW0J_003289 [Bradyrhizobium sp. i1.7.7]